VVRIFENCRQLESFEFSPNKLLIQEISRPHVPKMRARLAKLRSPEAAEIAEAALVMPVVFIFLLGIIWFGRAFNIYSTITQAAQQGALAAARSSCATCAAPTPPWGSTNFPGDATVANTVTAVMQASSLDTSQILSSASAGVPVFCAIPSAPAGACTTTPNNIKICREILLNQTAQLPVCGTTVSFQYPFQFYLPFTSLNLTQVVLSAQAQSRMEN
jgi:hypothetical protein